VGLSSLKLKGTNGNAYDYDFHTRTTPGAMSFSTKTQLGDKMVGNVVSNIPQDVMPQSLVYNDMYDKVTCNV
jgi:hypothetical protein